MYTDAIEQSSKMLGRTHGETLKLRFAYAYCLEKSNRPNEALEVIGALVPDLMSFKNDVWIEKVRCYRDSLLSKLEQGGVKMKPRIKRSRETIHHCVKRICSAQYEPGDSDKENSVVNSVTSSNHIT
jgi:hypothetical protein